VLPNAILVTDGTLPESAVDCPRVRLGITGLSSAAGSHWTVPEAYGENAE